jgi:hypothetical protein
MKVYQIYRTFESYRGEEVEIVEIPTRFIYTDKGMAEKVLNNKQYCSDVNVMCDEWIIKEFTLIESENDLYHNYTDIYAPLEFRTLNDEY